MKNEAKVSKQPFATRLFERDQSFLKTAVKFRGSTDDRFKDHSSAIRHYVRLGIISEKRLQSANMITDRVVKDAQKEVLYETLLPLKNSIDKLIRATEEVGEKQDRYAMGLTNNFSRLEDRIMQFLKEEKKRDEDIFRELKKSENIDEESLRNIIILRSLLFVFLLAHKVGRINPDLLKPWEEVVSLTARKARELSVDEVILVKENREIENDVIKDMTRQIFIYIRQFTQEQTQA